MITCTFYICLLRKHIVFYKYNKELKRWKNKNKKFGPRNEALSKAKQKKKF